MTEDEMRESLIAESLGDPIDAPEQCRNGKQHVNGIPVGLNVTEILGVVAPERQMLIETLVPKPGAVLLVGSHKSGKTVLAMQIAVAVASGHPFMDNYRIPRKGPVIVVEQDDTAGDVSMRDYLRVSPVPVVGIPLRLFVRLAYRFSPEFYSWLESEIYRTKSVLVILDSYTALRPHRHAGGDIVKTESDELALIDAIAKRHDCTIKILHHVSGGRLKMDWSDQSAGTFSMGAATEGQIHISRFIELPGNAPERLIQGRPRHGSDFAAVIRFRIPTLDYEFVMDGPGAPFYPDIVRIRKAFPDRAFTPKDLYHELGFGRTSAHHLIGILLAAGILNRERYGEYRIA